MFFFASCSEYWPFYCMFSSFFQCHDHGAYLVDALIDTNPMIKDWKTMANLLLSGEGR